MWDESVVRYALQVMIERGEASMEKVAKIFNDYCRSQFLNTALDVYTACCQVIERTG